MILSKLKTITRKNNKARGLVLPVFSLLTGLSLCGLASTTITANEVNALTYQSNIPVEFTFNPTISINLSSSDLIISDLTPGSSADSNIISVSVSTNATYGYNLSATVGSKGGTTALTNPNTSATFTNLATTAGAASTLSNIPDNYWGYSYSIDNGTSWISGDIDSSASGYAGLPLDNNDNVNEKGKGGIALQATTEASEATPIKFKIGAKASSSQPSGEYTNTINFYAVTNPQPEHPGPISCSGANKICYGADSFGAVEGTMGEQDANANTETTLLASNFSREGYGFAGWNTEPDYSGTFYGPQQTITTPADMGAGLPLYAVWVPSAGSMQTNTTAVCSSLITAPTNGTANLSSVSALTDERDNETYAIAKLADDNCWMIENLRLEAEYTRSAEHQALAQGYGTSTTYGNFSGLANAENANFTSTTGATDATEPNSLYYAGTQSGTASINISQTSYAGFRMPRYSNDNHQTTSANRPQNPTTNDANNSTTKAGMYSYGNYYTWAAAIANTNYYDGPTATDADGKTSETVGTSICPKGWKLPYGRRTGKGATSGGFSNLDIALGGTGASQYTAEASNRWRNFPNNFLYSGNFSGSSASNKGSYGYYWSSTAYNNDSSYILYLYSSYVDPGASSGYKRPGGSVRCVAGS